MTAPSQEQASVLEATSDANTHKAADARFLALEEEIERLQRELERQRQDIDGLRRGAGGGVSKIACMT